MDQEPATDTYYKRPFEDFIEEFTRNPDNVSEDEMEHWSILTLPVDEYHTEIYINFAIQVQLNSDLTTVTIPCVHMMHLDYGTSYYNYDEYAILNEGSIEFNLIEEELDNYSEAIGWMRSAHQRHPKPQWTWYLNNVTYRMANKSLSFEDFIETFVHTPHTFMQRTLDYYEIFRQLIGYDYMEIKFRCYAGKAQLVLNIKQNELVNGLHEMRDQHFEVIELTTELDQIKFNLPKTYRAIYDLGMDMLRADKQTSPVTWFLHYVEPNVKGCK